MFAGKLLILDDEPAVGSIVKMMAESLGLEARYAQDAAVFFREIEVWKPDFVSVDLVMPHLDGIELLRTLAQKDFGGRVILMSGLGKRVIETAGQLGRSLGLTVLGHLHKPLRLHDLEGIFALAQLPPPGKPLPARQFGISKEELLGAIERDEFVNFYQPQIEIATGAVVGFETLVRWQHPVHGLIYPDSFIPHSEAMGLIDDLGWLVARRAFAEIGAFDLGSGDRLSVSLNVSVHSLRALDFPDRFAALAGEFGILPEKIIFEVTESGLVRDLTNTLDVLARLRMKQFNLSIDDFGTGYSMMQQLQNIPATELKIDKSFVQKANTHESDRVMVAKTIEIGHELGMTVVAEGVETADQLEFLRLNGCEIAQGYFFSRPQPPAELLAWLRGYRPA